MNTERQGFWGQLGAPDRSRLGSAGRIKDFAAGETICRQGDPATHLYVLISGVLKVSTVSPAGQQSLIALRGDGDVVGELASALNGERTASMVAVTDVRAVVIGHDKFETFLDGCALAARAYRLMSARRFSATADSLSAHTTASGAQRLARLLIDLAERYGEADGPDGPMVIALPLSQEELASLASASRATATRALADWRGRGLIQTGTRRITITDPAALRRLGGTH